MIDAVTFRALMRRHKIDAASFAAAIERDPGDVVKWLAGFASIPPYIELTMIAVANNLPPVAPETVTAGPLGIEQSRVDFWHATGSVPMSARLAIAGYQWQAVQDAPLTNRDREILRQIDQGRYYRITGGWRSMPQTGRVLPQMHHDTPALLIGKGLVAKNGRGILHLTPRGKARL